MPQVFRVMKCSYLPCLFWFCRATWHASKMAQNLSLIFSLFSVRSGVILTGLAQEVRTRLGIARPKAYEYLDRSCPLRRAVGIYSSVQTPVLGTDEKFGI